MNKAKFRYFVGDFETTVYKGQEYTEVWASASVELYTEEVNIFHSIDEQFEYFRKLKGNICVYYHNLKFDGEFWLYYLIVKLGYKQGYDSAAKNFKKTKDLQNNEFTYSISDMGYWYIITIKTNDKIIEIRDSLKLIPCSVKEIGESFGTKHKKLDMEYEGFRYAGCEITETEKEYISNDILVVKEALEIMFNEGHKKLTIGSCCLSEYRNLMGNKEYKRLHPNLYSVKINESRYGYKTIGDYIRKSYKGGWCYLADGKENIIKTNGITLDVNSLYPSVMSSESGNRYPIGYPTLWNGNFIPEEAKKNTNYYFIRIRTDFDIKEGHLPFIQIKGNPMYKPTECLKTSKIYNKNDGKYYSEYIDINGKITNSIIELVLTCTDFELLQEHYNLSNFEILDGCYFRAVVGIFDNYIEKYKKIKLESSGAKKQVAKYFLNNLYGKMASSTRSSFKIAYLKEDNTIGYTIVESNTKIPGYIAIGSAITSYARNFTIRAAQQNYYGKDKPGFIYADTDSIHCDLPIEEIKGVKLHDKNFCCWKHESSWEKAKFVRQKTYIEVIDGKYDIKCAGMPKKCKELLKYSFNGNTPSYEITEEENNFIKTKRTIEDFKQGLIVPGKLLPKRINGGVILTDTSYELR